MEKESLEPSSLKIFVIDDHELVLGGTVEVLKRQYPKAEIITTSTTGEVLKEIERYQPNLVVLDLSLPERKGEIARVEIGIQLLKSIMVRYSSLNLMVQSTYIQSLVRIRLQIDAHRGGFTVASKSLSATEMLIRAAWALQGISYTKDIKGVQESLEVKPEWLTVLTLAFEEGLQDKAIAQRMNVSERMVRHYWSKVQDALSVYPEEGKNIRIQTEKRAREEGLID